MRILHILNDVTDQGNGIVNAATDLAIEQVRQGHTVAMASAGGGFEGLLLRMGVQHFTLDQSRRLIKIARALRSFRRQIREFRPDVIHAHMRTGLLLAWFWKRFYHFALVAQVHNVHDRSSIMMGLADRVIAVSSSVAATMAKQGIAQKKIHAILNRTLGSPRQPSLTSITPAKLARPSIVTICGMNHRKGIAELIEAFEITGERFPDAHLNLVGDGPERELFTQQANASKWRERIHFEGFQSTPQAYMLSADIVVLASRRESFGLVLIEARQAGCAIVATDIDGVAEALDGGEAGMLVPPRNEQALSDAFCGLLANEQERRSWQNRALCGIEAFHVSVMALEVQDVYDELVRKDGWRDVARNALWE